MGEKASAGTKKKIANALRGRPSNMLGKKHSEKAKIAVGNANRGKRYLGKDNPNWRGGITPLAMKIRNCFKYRQWVSDVFTRDDFTCQKCGRRGGWLEAHHIKKFSKILEENKIKTFEQAIKCVELWNINNGQTLCGDCHYEETYKRPSPC